MKVERANVLGRSNHVEYKDTLRERRPTDRQKIERHGLIYKYIGRSSTDKNRHVDGWTDRQTDKQTDKRADKQTDKVTNRKIDR